MEGEKGILFKKFGIPPFSLLDAKQGVWINRKKEWLAIGLDSELGRDAKSINSTQWVVDKGLSGLGGLHSGVSIFDPVLCELLYKWFCKPRGKILDPFAGGSVRGIVASTFGYNYTGVDLRKEQVEANYKNITTLKTKLPIDPLWINGDSMNIKKLGEEYDMVMSCPPYHDLEKYSDDPNDISNMSYRDFMTNYKEIIKQSVSMLKNNSFAVFVISEIRDDKGFYRNFVGDTIQAFIDTGMKYYNEIILCNQLGSLPIRVTKQFEPYRKIGRLHQNVLVFYKGNTDLIDEMDLELNEFKPITEMSLPRVERTDKITVLDDVKVKNIVCEVCGSVSKDQEVYDAHLTRSFHMDRVE